MLLAHGACVHSAGKHRHCLRSPASELVGVFNQDGARFNCSSVLNCCPYFVELDAVRRVLELGVDWRRNVDALHRAAQTPNLALVELYLTEGSVDVDIRNEKGRMALMRALRILERVPGGLSADVPAVIRALLNAGANLTVRDNRGLTALHHLVWGEYVEIIELLLQAGADANAVIMDRGYMGDC